MSGRGVATYPRAPRMDYLASLATWHDEDKLPRIDQVDSRAFAWKLAHSDLEPDHAWPRELFDHKPPAAAAAARGGGGGGQQHDWKGRAPGPAYPTRNGRWE